MHYIEKANVSAKILPFSPFSYSYGFSVSAIHIHMPPMSSDKNLCGLAHKR